MLRKWAKATAATLEQHGLAKAKQRRDEWHAWLAEQKKAGGRQIYAWLKRDEAKWAPRSSGKQRQLDEGDDAWWQLWGRELLAAEQSACGLQLVQEGTGMPRIWLAAAG